MRRWWCRGWIRSGGLGLLWVWLGLAPAGAQVVVTNPGFGPREVLGYQETLGSVTRPFEASLTRGSGPGGTYEYRTVGTDLEAVYRLDPVSLVSLSSETVTRGADAEVRRTAEYRNLKPRLGAGDLAVTDLGSLPVVLRGYPWAPGSAHVVFVGNPGSASVHFVFTVTGRESVVAGGKAWVCWHATLGLDGALGLLVPKTEYWFAVEGTHPLVKTVGPSAGPGSPVRTLVLTSWAVTGSP